MRNVAFAFVAVVTALGPIVPACSSTQTASSTDAGGDATIGSGQLLGQPCDPTLSNPCRQAPCTTVTCDPAQLICVGTPLPICNTTEDSGLVFDSSSGDSGTVVAQGCLNDTDCPPIPAALDGGTPTNRVCAFSAFDGCGAAGVCLVPDPPHTQDGAPQVACGCDDQPVDYVADEYTAAPVQNPAPCVIDGGSGSVDAAADATPDAPATDASDGASPSDAGDDGG
jgi:hypothetical protein